MDEVEKRFGCAELSYICDECEEDMMPFCHLCMECEGRYDSKVLSILWQLQFIIEMKNKANGPEKMFIK